MPTNKKTQELLDQCVAPWVEKLPWKDTHPVRFDASEGYDGKGVLGSRAGTIDCIDFENLAHEMAHAIEILESGRPQALGIAGWGMHIKTVMRIGWEEIREPITMQASEREARVCGIQMRILDMVDHPTLEGFARRHAEVLTRWMPDYIFGGDTQEERIGTRQRLIEESYRQWPAARIQAAWRAVQPRLELAAQPKPANDEIMPARRRMGR